jgi:uncharacterized protein (DUF58 family)
LTVIRTEIDWLKLAPLRIKARAVADGLYTGNHRSWRKGAGVEFGGFREYLPGDDLRRLDRRSALRHDRLLIREFEMDTERPLVLVVDATASMAYKGERSRASKYAYASIVAAAMARVAVSNGDRIALHFLGSPERGAPLHGGSQSFERVCDLLEATVPTGDVIHDGTLLERSLYVASRSAKRGSVVVLLSDFFDLPGRAESLIGALALARRTLLCAQILDEDEVTLPFEGGFRLKAMEGSRVIEADETVRGEYLARVDALTAGWQRAIVSRGGRFARILTSQPALDSVRQLINLA